MANLISRLTGADRQPQMSRRVSCVHDCRWCCLLLPRRRRTRDEPAGARRTPVTPNATRDRAVNVVLDEC